MVLASAEPVQGCQVDGGRRATASFFNTGRGGLPVSPYESFSSNDIVEDVRLPDQKTSLQSTHPSDQTIAEADAWVVNEQGRVALVAKAPSQFHGCQLR